MLAHKVLGAVVGVSIMIRERRTVGKRSIGRPRIEIAVAALRALIRQVLSVTMAR